MATKTARKPKTTVKVQPLSDRILIRPQEAEERTQGGIYLPDTAKEKPLQGEVIAVGPGRLLESGERQGAAVNIGDAVLFGKYSGIEVKIDGDEYTIVRESDLLGIVD